MVGLAQVRLCMVLLLLPVRVCYGQKGAIWDVDHHVNFCFTWLFIVNDFTEQLPFTVCLPR